jgi:DNA-binding CsgD family transcriptional regulator
MDSAAVSASSLKFPSPDTSTDAIVECPLCPNCRTRLVVRVKGSVVEIIVSEPAPASPLGGDLLTRRENEIAELAAVGLSNRAIGAELGISPVTVGCMLSKVYRKLRLTNRSELIVYKMARQAKPPFALRPGLVSTERASASQ